MIDIETIVSKMMYLETAYFELQSNYQTLIHEFETLKEKHETHSVGHRNRPEPSDNLVGDN
tara:strand:+ start:512 stop:694 length:183 start_codon:yes stop_codon:yes gene_type:complete